MKLLQKSNDTQNEKIADRVLGGLRSMDDGDRVVIG